MTEDYPSKDFTMKELLDLAEQRKACSYKDWQLALDQYVMTCDATKRNIPDITAKQMISLMEGLAITLTEKYSRLTPPDRLRAYGDVISMPSAWRDVVFQEVSKISVSQEAVHPFACPPQLDEWKQLYEIVKSELPELQKKPYLSNVLAVGYISLHMALYKYANPWNEPMSDEVVHWITEEEMKSYPYRHVALFVRTPNAESPEDLAEVTLPQCPICGGYHRASKHGEVFVEACCTNLLYIVPPEKSFARPHVMLSVIPKQLALFVGESNNISPLEESVKKWVGALLPNQLNLQFMTFHELRRALGQVNGVEFTTANVTQETARELIIQWVDCFLAAVHAPVELPENERRGAPSANEDEEDEFAEYIAKQTHQQSTNTLMSLLAIHPSISRAQLLELFLSWLPDYLKWAEKELQQYAKDDEEYRHRSANDPRAPEDRPRVMSKAETVLSHHEAARAAMGDDVLDENIAKVRTLARLRDYLNVVTVQDMAGEGRLLEKPEINRIVIWADDAYWKGWHTTPWSLLWHGLAAHSLSAAWVKEPPTKDVEQVYFRELEKMMAEKEQLKKDRKISQEFVMYAEGATASNLSLMVTLSAWVEDYVKAHDDGLPIGTNAETARSEIMTLLQSRIKNYTKDTAEATGMSAREFFGVGIEAAWKHLYGTNPLTQFDSLVIHSLASDKKSS